MEEDWERQSLYQRSGRLLCLNSQTDLLDLISLLESIVSKACANTERKFRTLKLSNKIVSQRIVARKGGLEFLGAIGFDCLNVDGEKCLVLNESMSEEEIRQQLDLGLAWLKETASACLKMALTSEQNENQTSSSMESTQSHNKCCAECIIQLKIGSSGVSVYGGFNRADTLQNILEYAHCFFKLGVQDSVTLCYPHKGVICKSDMTTTLHDAGLYPRAVLIASTQTESRRGETLDQRHSAGVVGMKVIQEKAKGAKDAKMREIAAEKQHRVNVLNQFKEDRSDQEERRCFTYNQSLQEREAVDHEGGDPPDYSEMALRPV